METQIHWVTQGLFFGWDCCVDVERTEYEMDRRAKSSRQPGHPMAVSSADTNLKRWLTC